MTHRLCLVMLAKAGIHDFLFKIHRATKSQSLRRLVLVKDFQSITSTSSALIVQKSAAMRHDRYGNAEEMSRLKKHLKIKPYRKHTIE